MRQQLSLSQSLAFNFVLAVVVLLGGCSSSGDDDDGNIPLSGALTEPPGADDEPVLELAELNNAKGFDIYREPHVRLPERIEEQDTAGQQEFESGLPEAVVTTPAGLDTQDNRAPFFLNLQNLDVLAGEVVAIRFKPEDQDGELPGMFPQKLPLGASFEDNLDGSKTLRWQPLQEDVGILRFTVVAVDAVEPAYQSSQSVLIRVSLPQDLSSIPNVAPMLEPVREYTLRVNDAAVVELKGQDLNGTVPTLEVLQLPDGASFLAHPRFEEVYVLKFTPAAVGEFSLDILARDSVDTSLKTTTTLSFNVLGVEAFDGVGEPLKQLAAQRNFQIGFAALQSFYHQPDGVIYADVAAREFNIVTPENSMKMDTINPLPGQYEFAATDNLVRFAQLHDMRIHAHPLLWYRQVPTWIEQSEPVDREQHMSEYIERIMGRYAGDIDIWDVINEPMEEDGSLRNSVWFEAMDEQYMDKALTQARKIAPDATLLINEFDISMQGPKFDGLLALVERLQQREVPLDGIGFQMHLFADYSTFDELRANFQRVADLGLDIYITELDVSLVVESTPEALQQQADVYRAIASICVEQAACKALQMWGFTDQYSFRSNFNPVPFDRSYRSKPAYQALQEALQQ